MTALSIASVWRDFEIDGVPISGPHKVDKKEVRALFAGFDAMFITPMNYGAVGVGATDDRVAVQAAWDDLNTLYLADGIPRILWFDRLYIVGGAKHANGFSIIDAKQGVGVDGPGGLMLAANTNVAESIFTATFSGTTMTIASVARGTTLGPQFLTGAGNALPAALKVDHQLTGSGLVVGATFQVTASCGTIASPIVVKGITRMVELIGAYNSTGNRIDDVAYRNIILDYNGQNNCEGGTIWSFNAVMSIQTGSGVDFYRLRVRNNCGSNSLVLGTYQASPTLGRCRVMMCTFVNDGDRINPSSVDYSTVFIVGTDCEVLSNIFGVGPTINGTAWELYGSVVANDNNVADYFNVCNLVAIASQTTSIEMSGNRASNVSVGFTLWTLAATAKLRVFGVGNTCHALVGSPGGPYFVNGVDQVTSGSEVRLDWIGNRWRNTVLTDATRTADGISVKSVLYAKIAGNTIEGIPGRGIYVTGTLSPCMISITFNTLINVGYTSTTAKKKAIALDASGSNGSLLIAANDINPLSGYSLTTGIDNALSVDNGLIEGNMILSSTTPLANTGGNVIVKSLRGVGYGPSELGTVTQATSKSTGATMNKRSGQITMNNAALAAGATVSFTLTNSTIEATDTPVVSIASGATAGAYRAIVDAVAVGSCRISVTNSSGGSLSEAIVLNFNLIKGGS